MTLEQLLLYSDIGASIVILIAIWAIYRIIQKPVYMSNPHRRIEKQTEKMIDHMKDVYQEAWEGDPIQSNKRMETIK